MVLGLTFFKFVLAAAIFVLDALRTVNRMKVWLDYALVRAFHMVLVRPEDFYIVMDVVHCGVHRKVRHFCGSINGFGNFFCGLFR